MRSSVSQPFPDHSHSFIVEVFQWPCSNNRSSDSPFKYGHQFSRLRILTPASAAVQCCCEQCVTPELFQWAGDLCRALLYSKGANTSINILSSSSSPVGGFTALSHTIPRARFFLRVYLPRWIFVFIQYSPPKEKKTLMLSDHYTFSRIIRKTAHQKSVHCSRLYFTSSMSIWM